MPRVNTFIQQFGFTFFALTSLLNLVKNCFPKHKQKQRKSLKPSQKKKKKSPKPRTQCLLGVSLLFDFLFFQQLLSIYKCSFQHNCMSICVYIYFFLILLIWDYKNAYLFVLKFHNAGPINWTDLYTHHVRLPQNSLDVIDGVSNFSNECKSIEIVSLL